MTLSFTPDEWCAHLESGAAIPPGLSIYTAWGEPGDYRAHCFGPGGMEDGLRSAMIGLDPGEAVPVLKWVVLATDWDAACTRYHELQGWEAYVLMG